MEGGYKENVLYPPPGGTKLSRIKERLFDWFGTNPHDLELPELTWNVTCSHCGTIIQAREKALYFTVGHRYLRERRPFYYVCADMVECDKRYNAKMDALLKAVVL